MAPDDLEFTEIPIGDLPLYSPDFDDAYRFDPEYGLTPAVITREACDVRLGSESLHFAFKFLWGGFFDLLNPYALLGGVTPESVWVSNARHQSRLERAVETIADELRERLDELEAQGKLLERQRLEQRTRFDLEMLREIGYCHGIENYARHLTGRPPGAPPPTLLDYLPRDAKACNVPYGRVDTPLGAPGWNEAFQQKVVWMVDRQLEGAEALHGLTVGRPVVVVNGVVGRRGLNARRVKCAIRVHARFERRDELRVAHHETHAPAGHVVALGQGEELHRDVLGSRHLHDGRRLPAVEDDVGIGEVVHDEDVVLAGQRDDALEEVQLHALRRGVARKADDDHLRLRVAAADGALEFAEEVHPRAHRHRPDVGACDHGPVDVDGVARVRHQHGVAPVERGQHQVRQAFLRADGDDGLRLGVDVDGVAIAVPVRDGTAQSGDALGGRVAVGVGTLRGLGELAHDVLGRGPVGVAHAHVDDVFAAAAGSQLELGRDVEDVGRKAIDAREAALACGGGHGRSFT